MDEEEIAEKIRYILEPVGQSPPLFYPAKQTTRISGRVREFSNEQVELLLALESKIDSQSNKDFFWELLGCYFIWPVPIAWLNIFPPPPKGKALLMVRQHCDITAMVYMKSGRVDQVLNGLLERMKEYDSINESNLKVISSFSAVILYEPYLFSNHQLKQVEVILERLQGYTDKVIKLLKKQTEEREQRINEPALPESISKALFGNVTKPIQPPLPSYNLIEKSQDLMILLKNGLMNIRFERVKEELRGVSSEINQDKKQLISKYSELGFGKELIEALERVDVETEETGSKFKYSQSIGFVRNIYEESLRQIAVKIRDATGVAIPQWTDNKGKMGEAIDYFKHIKFIFDKEEKLLTGFSGIISDTGSHSLTSERYEVRIAKNILVEICSYLVDKVDNYLKTSQKTKLE